MTKNISEMEFELNGQQYKAELGKCKSAEIIAAVENTREAILEAIALLPAEALRLNSTLFVSPLPGFKNMNGAEYYQVKARNVGDETEIVFGDRDGNVAMTLITPYNAALLNMMFIFSSTVLARGFCEDVQSAYKVSFNQITMDWDSQYSNSGTFLCVSSLEIHKLDGSDDYTILGELYYGNSPANVSPVVLQGVVPIPAN